MARIATLQPGKQSVGVHPTSVDCYFQTVTSTDGAVLLHLTSFGSDVRATPPKSSQSLQIDETIARELMELLRKTFPALG